VAKFYKEMEAVYDMPEFSWAAKYASRPGTMAAYLDQLIMSRNTIEEIVAQAMAEAQRRGHRTKYTAGTINGHLKFRIQQAARNKKNK
jgi:hypothetical protein